MMMHIKIKNKLSMVTDDPPENHQTSVSIINLLKYIDKLKLTLNIIRPKIK